MVKYVSLIVLIAALLLSSCTKFTAPERFDGEVYSIAGLLVSGQQIDAEHPIYITRSETLADFDPMSLFVTDAVVVIKDITANLQWTLDVYPDLTAMKIKYVDNGNHIIQPQHRYRIEVQIPGHDGLISAETVVPVAVQLVPDFMQNNIAGEGYSLYSTPMPTIKYNDVDRKYPLAMNTGAYAGPVNFMAEMYCLEEFSTELEFTNPVFGMDHPDAGMEDSYNAGGESIRRIQFIGPYVSKAQEGLADNYLVIKDYRQAFVFYGNYRVTLWAADDNYYRYTYMPEGYFHGGVQGALGFFGSVSGGTLFAKIIK